MIELFQNVLSGVTGGLLGERVRHHLDRLSNPVRGPDQTSSNEILEQIRDLLYAGVGSVKPPVHRLRQNVRLQAFPDVAYTVTYEGRAHLNMQAGASFNLYVEGTIGRYSIPVFQGWNNLDFLDGTRLYVPAGAAGQDVVFEYAAYIHGTPLSNANPAVDASGNMIQGANSVTTATLQNAATAVGNGTAIDVSGMSTLLVALSGTFVASVAWEVSIDSTNGTDGTWFSISGETPAGQIVSTTSTPGFTFRFSVVGWKMFRARITTYTSGNVTVIARAQGNDGPLPQTNMALYGAGSTTSVVVGAPADGAGGSIGLYGDAQQLAFNGSSWDRQRSNQDVTLLASAARTATTSSADQVNYNGRGIMGWFAVTAVPGVDTVTLKVEGKDPVGGTYYNIAFSAAISATGFYSFVVYPGMIDTNATQNFKSGLPMPRTWRVTVTHSAATSFTYSVGASVIL